MNQSIYERRLDVEMQLESIAEEMLEFQKELEEAMKLQSIKIGTYENYEEVLETFTTIEWAARKLRERYEDSHMYYKELLEIKKEEAVQLETFKASPEYTALRIQYNKCATETACKSMKISRNQMWRIIRSVVSEYEGEDKWAFDEFWLAANYYNCYMEGKHSKTTDKEWEILKKIITQEPCIYSEEICKQLFDLLCKDERLDILVAMLFPDIPDHPAERVLLRSCSGRPYLPYNVLVDNESTCWCGNCRKWNS